MNDWPPKIFQIMSDAAESKSRWVIETTQETFQRDVIDRSHDVPVVLDFWAGWCQPCRMLSPVLEQLAAQFGGKFVLVKADVEKTQGAAAEFAVQGIPAVFAVVAGKAVDFFEGVLPPNQVRGWIECVLSHAALVEAQRLEETDPQAAAARYREIVDQSPNESTAQIGLARALLALGQDAESRNILAALEQRGFLEAEAEKVKAQLELQSMADSDTQQIRAAVAEKPNDLALQFQLASALAGQQQYAEALEICLQLVRQDRHGCGEQARQLMVDIFRVLPDDSELTRDYRRKLSLALY